MIDINDWYLWPVPKNTCGHFFASRYLAIYLEKKNSSFSIARYQPKQVKCTKGMYFSSDFRWYSILFW